MKRLPITLALVVAGVAACDQPTTPPVMDPNKLTSGVMWQPPGCPYSVTTPAETTTPLPDDGTGSAAPRAVHLSWIGDPSSSVAITWVSDNSSHGARVDWGADTSYGQTAKGITFAYPADLAGNDIPSVRVHQVHLCGLTPGTTYHYRAAAGSGMAADASFTTAPSPSTSGKPLRFAVTGDSRGNALQWGEVLKDAAATGADFVLYSGDAVTLGSIQGDWDAWFDAGKSVLPSLPLMFAAGNHEISARHYFAQLTMPGNGQWYSFDYGDVHVVVLDDTPVDPASIAGDQVKFLDADLGATQKKWKVVMHHRAIFSSSTHGSQMDVQRAWMPLYDKHGVDVVFNGHDHDYERTKTMKGGVVAADGKGTVYVVNGGGGADLYPSGNMPFTAFSQSTYAYTVVDVMGPQLTVTAFAVSNGTATQIDRVVLNK